MELSGQHTALSCAALPDSGQPLASATEHDPPGLIHCRLHIAVFCCIDGGLVDVVPACTHVQYAPENN